MADKYDSNGDYSGCDFKRKGSSDKINSNDEDNDDQNPAAQKAGEYIRELLAEKLLIDQNKLPNAARLIDMEVARVQNIGKVPMRETKYVDIYREKPMKVAVKVLVPVREHPKFNFVGKLLGPKGNSMKRLQEDTMCKMAVLGRGSMKDRQKEDELRKSLDPKYAHLCDDLHVEISALGPPAEAHARIAFALAEVRKYLIPDNNDNIRQEQMREMEIITAADPAHKEGPPPTKRPSGILRGAAPTPRPPVPMRTATRMPVTTPRVMPAKTKIMSILDRARIAMEESYGGAYEEPYEPNEPSYDSYPTTVSHSRSTYSSHHYSHPEYEPEYYRESSATYEEPSTHRWKPYKTSSSSSRHSESTRYRDSPYSRPSK
ncbi:hypothetical protein RI129_003030 [Pyrocoelia pectoralis]|uniref:K Homology domain-containing protein n=1 Tax=Pyrocoelia pectoralis TaxID=417401 RepID=A0AAN7VPF3_9COLE